MFAICCKKIELVSLCMSFEIKEYTEVKKNILTRIHGQANFEGMIHLWNWFYIIGL